jgi:hypothetical protein
MSNTILKIIIFVLLFVFGTLFFKGFGESAGATGGILFIGESILGSSLSSDGGSLTQIIISFIITAAVYYILAEIITLIILRLFGKKQ